MLNNRGCVLGDHLKEPLSRRDLAIKVDKTVLATLFSLGGCALGFNAETLEEPWIAAERGAVSTKDINEATAPKGRALDRERQGTPVKLRGEHMETTFSGRSS